MTTTFLLAIFQFPVPQLTSSPNSLGKQTLKVTVACNRKLQVPTKEICSMVAILPDVQLLCRIQVICTWQHDTMGLHI